MIPRTVAILAGLVSAFGMIGSVVWVGFLVHLARHRRAMVHLVDVPDREPAGGWPSLAVIIAARDEAASIGVAARSILAQDYPNLGVVAVDDRSTDGTGAILDAIAVESDRLRVVHVTGLPDGWLGKTHALQVGAEASRARWLLFTDADVVFEPGSLRRAIAFAEAEAADHVTALPEVTSESMFERAFLAFFGLLFTMNARPGSDRRLRQSGSCRRRRVQPGPGRDVRGHRGVPPARLVGR